MKCPLLNYTLFSHGGLQSIGRNLKKKSWKFQGKNCTKKVLWLDLPLCKSLVGAYNMSKQYQQIFMVLAGCCLEKEKTYCSHIKCTIVSYYQGKNFRLTELTQVTQSDSGVF